MQPSPGYHRALRIEYLPRVRLECHIEQLNRRSRILELGKSQKLRNGDPAKGSIFKFYAIQARDDGIHIAIGKLSDRGLIYAFIDKELR
jgi:hypothetical protein